MPSEIEKEYKKFREKYTLPEFKEIDDEFEISLLECTDFLLRNVRRKIMEKITLMLTCIEEIIQPETNLRSMTELKAVSQSTKNKAFSIYKNLMIAERSSLEFDISSTDEKEAEFIMFILKKWKELKPDMLILIEKIKEVWKREQSPEEEEIGYVG